MTTWHSEVRWATIPTILIMSLLLLLILLQEEEEEEEEEEEKTHKFWLSFMATDIPTVRVAHSPGSAE